MFRALSLSLATVLFSGVGLQVAYPYQSKAEQAAENTKARAKDATADRDVTYGRVKELTPGQKVVINVDNAPDKTFDLADKDVTVKLGKGLKPGDPVKVEEHEVMGKTKSVMISKHTGGGVKHGEPHPITK